MIDDALTFSRRYEISLVSDGFVSFVPSELCNDLVWGAARALEVFVGPTGSGV